MGAFDINKFESQQYQTRTADVPVPGLAAYFPDGEDPVWKVRNLEGEELAAVGEAVERAAATNRVLDLVAKADNAGKAAAAAVQVLIGATGDTPQSHIREMRMFHAGSVEPQIDYPLVVKLAQHHPVEFKQIVQEILRLTGLGSDVKKKQNSSTPIPK